MFTEERNTAEAGLDFRHAEGRAGERDFAGHGMFESLEEVARAELLRLEQIADGVDEGDRSAGGVGGLIGLARVLAARPFVDDGFELVVVLEAGAGVLEALIFGELRTADRLREPGPVAGHDVQAQIAFICWKDADRGGKDVAAPLRDIALEVGPPRQVKLER